MQILLLCPLLQSRNNYYMANNYMHSVQATFSEAMLALSFSTLLVVFDENTEVSTRVNGWQYFRWMSI